MRVATSAHCSGCAVASAQSNYKSRRCCGMRRRALSAHRPRRGLWRCWQALASVPLRGPVGSPRPNASAQPRDACTGRFDLVSPLRRLVCCSALLAGRLRAVRQRRNEAALSAEGNPQSRASTEMSSSMSGQWMPTPGPINTHARRSRGDASASRGYQRRGTDTTRPSASATVNTSSVTRTCLAAAVPAADAKVLMPCLQEFGLVLLDETHQSLRLARPKSEIGRQSGWRQPELRQSSLACDVHVRRFGSVAREEEEPIRTALKNGRTHVA